MAALAPILRAHGASTLVDSVSGLGASEFLMDEWGYDAVATASQKAFAAPPGVAMIALSDRARKRVADARIGAATTSICARAMRVRRTIGQTPWTPPISILFALDVALAALPRRRHARRVRASRALRARRARSAASVWAFRSFSQPGAHSDTVVAAYPPAGVDPARCCSSLRENYGVVLSGGQGELAGKIVRFGTMGDVGEADRSRDRASSAIES